MEEQSTSSKADVPRKKEYEEVYYSMILNHHRRNVATYPCLSLVILGYPWLSFSHSDSVHIK